MKDFRVFPSSDENVFAIRRKYKLSEKFRQQNQILIVTDLSSTLNYSEW